MSVQSLQINPLYLASTVVIWLLVYHVTYWLTEAVGNASLICWSVGPFGLSTASLREPRVRRILSQLFISACVCAVVVYACLFLLRPGPVNGLDQDPLSRAIAVAVPVIALTLLQFSGVVRAWRFPLWGEARVMARVQRSQATGAILVFTPLGRAFLRDRFGATPGEFARMVRY